jgi:hypothetical protein
MADHRNDDDRTLPGGPGMNRTPETDPEHLIPEHTHAAPLGTIGAELTPDDPDAVRGEIERTRERMSQTIGAIEGALLKKKEEINDRLDFTAPVRQRPWAFAGGVFGTGLVLGLLTGGGKSRDEEEDREHVKIPRALLEGIGLEPIAGGHGAGNGRGGSREWEDRSRELMQVVARQEEEIRDLRAAVYGDADWDVDAYGADAPESIGVVDVENEWDEDWNFGDEEDDFQDFEALGMEEEHEGGGISKPIAGLIAAGIAGLVGGLAKKYLGGSGDADEMQVEVDLEPRGGGSIVDDYSEHYTASGVVDAEAAMRRERARSRPVERPVARPAAEREREHHYQYTNRPPSYGRPVEIEVDLETPAPRAYARPRRRLHAPEMSPLAGAVAVGAAVAFSGLVARILHNRGERAQEMDVEVELEERPGYRPSAQPRAAYTPPRPQPSAAPRQGELEVEVDLEQQRPRGYSDAPEYPRTAQPQGDGDIQAEVDLEPRAGEQPFRGGQGGTSGQGGLPSDPPLM